LIVSGTLSELKNYNFGEPLHTFVICAPNLHSIELEMFEFYKIKK